ncbi:MAG: DUF1572 family protein [Saprospiraceae bacterium]|nr:DUF1572 family protein [Saprospiraceae bacterium]
MDRIKVYKKQFEYYKGLAEKSIDQLSDDQLFETANAGCNSIAVIMKHISGNMHSRWTNIFEEDGEKEWRNRDEEFIDRFNTKAEVLEYWNSGWAVLFHTLSVVSENELDRIIYIRNMGCTVHDAIIRQLCHYPYHVGQIVHIAKNIKGESFKSLSIPKGASKGYNATRFDKKKTIKHFTDDNEK